MTAAAKAWHGLPFWHGRLGSGEVWPAPALVAQEANEARPGFSSCSADEYEDLPEVLAAKAKVVADLLRRSRYTVAYTGAGISTAAGIKDYASKAQSSKVKRLVTHESPEEGLEAEPTTSHRFFVALWRKKLLHHWVQQNHDGLPQKAGYPQHALNEIHGSWFDPSNPVVHFRAELRSSNFGWLLDAELRAELVLAVGTSLCDTPSTADRLVVSAAEHAHSLGAVVVSLQRTRLDRHVQLRVFAEADHFFQLVAQELEIHLCEPEICDAPAQIVLPDLVYLAAGPSAGRALRWRRKGSMLELDGGHLMGAWWLSCQAHPCPFPLANTMSRPMRARRVIDAARLVEAPFLTGPPAAFLSGRWRGDALRLAGREAHPSAEAERAQDLCWVLVVQGEELAGVGFTTWPAAHVLCGAAGRTWHRLVGRVAEGGTFQLELTWEDVVASRRPSEPLSEQQRCGGRLCCQINGRVWWDDRHGQFLLAGLWQDEEGVSGALLMSQEPNACAGRWEGSSKRYVLAVDPAQKPEAFGMVLGNSADGQLIRGFCEDGKVILQQNDADGSVQRQTFQLRLHDAGAWLVESHSEERG
ncbi:NAD-dependent protein deacetylase Sirt7 (Regulatory protein SIR2 homolog 7) (SIR2-like protein 7) [Durusdinium trenchii]|uniref:NAD-dependent protein deacetylase Sirt7 (Regulatory protein SIR2 homolog 7) (SIR2-like protein 7) n=1 Tax=Durusdinium trenchii TaxID=1381693 RepID=A0ABP0RUP1_9DINO